MKKFILNLIDKKKKRYIEDYSEMLGDYKRELETIKGYNGRQLLELLQNSDDEGATKVTITLNEDDKTISISNNGETSFSEKGYRSLFIANLSSKTTRKYIGNKGLGFRSIINWSKSIEIQSNNLSLLYSTKNTRANYEKLFAINDRQNIAKEENLEENTIPMPFLSMPVLNDINQGDFKTAIIIKYKKKAFKGILSQVENITPETLLFLKHIKEVDFKGFNDIENIKCDRNTHLKKAINFSPKEAIKFTNNSWSIFEEEKKLPQKFQDTSKKEKEYYQIKIAVEDNFEKSSPNLYSFFPTNIKLNQPYVLHATFDLDATRNQLNDSEKNKFILKEVVDFTIKVSKYYSQTKVSYQPLSILNHTHKADTLNNLGYYDLIDEAVNNQPVFPCIDNTYRTLKEVLYINDEFAELLEDVNAQDVFPIHLLPLEELSLQQFNLENRIKSELDILENYLDLLNEISEKNISNKHRAIWIRLITEKVNFDKKEQTKGLNFLINKEGKPIDGNEYIYTPVSTNKSTSEEKELKRPSFTKIQFINDDLFNHLLNEFKFETNESSNKGRFIYDQLKTFCNIHSYEPATLSQKIISETNNQIKKDETKANEYIQEMNYCLYYNFKLMKESTKIPDDTIKIPSITKNGKIAFTEDTVLSAFYPTGEKTTLIFKGVYPDEKFIAKPSDLGLDENEDIYNLEKFLKWIKVNDYAKYNNNSFINSGIDNYVKFIQTYHGFEKQTGYSINHKTINDFKSLLDKISIEKLILWIYYDDVLKQQLYDNNNEDKFQYFYRTYHTVKTKPSYLKFLIIKNYKYNFSQLLIDEKYSWVNNFKINYNEILDFDTNIKKTTINEILVNLDAKDDFKQLPIEKVSEIINKLPEKYPTGSKSQTFYRKALSHYTDNKKQIKEPLKLFAHNGKELALYNQDEIYFSEKIKLPNKLKKDFPIFNYPQRAGGAEAIKFFKINDLKEIKIEIDNEKLNVLPEKTATFNSIINSLKPFLLSYRLNVIEDVDVRKNQASICKKINIQLSSNINYKVKENSYEVVDYEFLHSHEQTYIIKIKESDDINSLIKNVTFTNSFADIISLAFDVNNDRNEYKYILRSDFEDVENSVKNDLGIDTLNDARELLGLADYKQSFWQAIFLAKDKVYDEELDDLALENALKDKLNFTYDTNSIDYENINTENELEKLESLLSDLDLSLEKFSEKYTYKISLKPFHLDFIKNALLSKTLIIKSSIWSILKEKSIEEQANYLKNINQFENYQSFAEEQANILKHQFKLDELNIFELYKTSIYPELNIVEEIDLQALKNKNEEIFNEDELYKISQSERLKSLIYFDNAIEIIKQELKTATNPITVTSEGKEKGTEKVTIKISNRSLKSTKPKTGKKLNGVYTPKEKNNRQLKEIGNKSEQAVYDYLKNNNYKNVDFVSQDNEGLQCDIRYTNKKGIVKYVEVKNFDSGSFFLSKYEYDFGLKNQKDYEIWLVKNKSEIFQIFDFFTNSKYIKNVSEYIIHLEIANN